MDKMETHVMNKKGVVIAVKGGDKDFDNSACFRLKSRPCRDFLYLMDMDEDANYTENLNVVINSRAKRGYKIDKAQLEKEIDLYM